MNGGKTMTKYIIKRILISIVILFFVSLIIYTLMRCLPTSYIEAMARQKSMQPGSKSFEEWMEQLTAMYNMDKSIPEGFIAWIGSMFQGDFGDSWKWTVPVIEKFNSTVWVSFAMGAMSFVLEVLIAIPLGIIAATKQYSKTDYTISVVALAGISLPTFFFASFSNTSFTFFMFSLIMLLLSYEATRTRGSTTAYKTSVIKFPNSVRIAVNVK